MSLTVSLVAAAVLLLAGVLLTLRKAPPPRAQWGAWPDDTREMTTIARYFHARPTSVEAGIDDRTWTDLNMDAVFSVVDRAESRVGQQVLYARLRSAPDTETRAAFETLVTRFQTDEPRRQQAQGALSRMRHVDAHDLWWLVQLPGHSSRSSTTGAV